jgi:hypothetical protein
VDPVAGLDILEKKKNLFLLLEFETWTIHTPARTNGTLYSAATEQCITNEKDIPERCEKIM